MCIFIHIYIYTYIYIYISVDIYIYIYIYRVHPSAAWWLALQALAVDTRPLPPLSAPPARGRNRTFPRLPHDAVRDTRARLSGMTLGRADAR